MAGNLELHGSNGKWKFKNNNDGTVDVISESGNTNLTLHDDGSVSAPESMNTPVHLSNGEAVQSALSGHVVPVGPDLGVGDAVAKDASNNPVQDVLDKFSSAGTTGQVLLPGEVHVDSEINPVDGVSILGTAIKGSRIVFDSDTRGLNFDFQGGNMTIDRVRLVGPGDANSTKTAIRYGASANNIHYGQIAIEGWAQAIRSKWSAPFQISHDHVQIGGCDAGDKDALVDFGGGGPPIQFDYLTAYPTKGRTGSPSTVLRVGGDGSGTPAMQVGQMNIGTSAKEAVKVNFSNGFECGHIHYECPYQGMVPEALVKLRRPRGGHRLGSFFLHTGDCDHVVKAYSNPRAKIGPIGTGTDENVTINNSKVLVSNGGNELTGTTVYDGPLSDITVSNVPSADYQHIRSVGEGPMPIATGTFTHSGGSSSSTTVTGLMYDASVPFDVNVYQDTDVGFQYAYSYDWTRVFNNDRVDVTIDANWVNDPGSGNDVTLGYEILPA